MTKRFVRRADTVALDLGEGDVVHLKRKQTYGDSREIATLLAARGQPEKHVSEYLIRLLEINVIAWEGPGFTDDAGVVISVSRDNLDALDDEVAAAIVTKIEQLNPGRQKEEGQASPLGTPPPPSPSVTPSASLDGSPSSASASVSAGPGTSSSGPITT